ncbi:lytic transglycosylase domain-containing protein [Desulfobulbus alkaliphilus]|uniref:lytic transglycosylase domain-containing protein n=1 Tax=Desulfobulbus alkaliphilus TaxID=869814 RepID=UPI00196326FD|nr:lytic transglycosylase domain-containing protein [Desulfobulbus alkaliphilus]MBM9538695.1 lytic transglycosylase domain-containing protein [Desulfobulbus alkaliphilus]
MTLPSLSHRLVAILVFFLVVLTGSGWGCCTGLENHLRKYSQVRISQAQLAALKEFDDLIRYFSGIAYHRPHHTVSADFIRALILAESNGNPLAISTKNARGLSQIIPATGQQAAAELARGPLTFHHVSRDRLRNLSAADLHDPAVNILLACYLIAKYNTMYDGRLDLVVAAWNAGPGSIVDQNPPRYRETLDLIGKVNGYYLFFLQGWNSGSMPRTAEATVCLDP